MLRGVRNSDPRVRRTIADHHARYATVIRARCAGIAMVVGSPLERGLLTALFWVSPPTYRYAVVGTVEVGERWGRRELSVFGGR